MQRNVVIVSGVRTPIGTFGGALKDIAPIALAAACVREAVVRANLKPEDIGSSVFGNIIHTEPRDMYFARVAAIEAGLPSSASALTVNRLCGSGLQAVVSAAQQIKDGDADIVVAGGGESMSRAPYALTTQRWGQKMGDAKAVDMLVGTLTDPFGHGHMGVTAENVAAKWKISRAQQDAFAVESHRKAAHAVNSGRFDEQIVPIEIKSRRETIVFKRDEQPRADTTLERIATLKPVFKEGGTVTAGNASTINDGAAALVMMAEEVAQARGMRSMARLLAHAYCGVDPSEMGIGPIPAVEKALKRAGLKLSDMDVIESNEAFAAQALAVQQTLGFPEDRTNPNGGAIALGHPVGATGCILVVKAIYELHRIQKRYGLVTLCIGGGQGIAAIIERPQ